MGSMQECFSKTPFTVIVALVLVLIGWTMSLVCILIVWNRQVDYSRDVQETKTNKVLSIILWLLFLIPHLIVFIITLVFALYNTGSWKDERNADWKVALSGRVCGIVILTLLCVFLVFDLIVLSSLGEMTGLIHGQKVLCNRKENGTVILVISDNIISNDVGVKRAYDKDDTANLACKDFGGDTTDLVFVASIGLGIQICALATVLSRVAVYMWQIDSERK